MGLISPASGRETEIIVASGSSSKILAGSGPYDCDEDIAAARNASDCIETYWDAAEAAVVMSFSDDIGVHNLQFFFCAE
ncbi:hypothetical protein U1Q18_035762 [Sarracenia purpurea var. burkii]